MIRGCGRCVSAAKSCCSDQLAYEIIGEVSNPLEASCFGLKRFFVHVEASGDFDLNGMPMVVNLPVVAGAEASTVGHVVLDMEGVRFGNRLD
jgi:hypothetical protein